jgi:predicted enzyme related to lactoylglutathione lyase
VTTLHRVIVSVSNIDRALALYNGVLGCEVTGRQGDIAVLRTDDEVELMFHQRPVDRGDAAVAVSFGVHGLAAVVDAWVAAGGAVIDPPARQPWGEEMAVVRDVDGHVVCLNAVP